MTIPNTSIYIKGIASVLSSARLEVPVYQRSFVWEEQVQEFLDDVGDAFARNKEEYFLGSLVVIASPETELITVLDGQQRLAVTSLLLAGVSHQFDARGDKERAQEIRRQYLTKFDILEGTKHPQLKLNQMDDAYFRSILNKEVDEPGRGAPESHRRLGRARDIVSKWLIDRLNKSDNPVSWLAEFTKYLDKTAYVVYFAVADDANAFLIFETMNDRGLDLSIADLLKNYLLGHAKDDLPLALNQWNTAIASLSAYGGENLFTVFLRHFWSSKYGLVREKELYRNIKLRVSSSANVVDFAAELVNNASHYAAILSPDHEFWTEASAKSRDHIRTLSFLGLEQYRPMLLSALAHFETEELESLLGLLISWSVRLLIVGGLGGGAIEKNYCELGKAIRNGQLKSIKEIAGRANKFFVPNDAIFHDSFVSARVSQPFLARYYLRQLESTAKNVPQPEQVPNADPTELTLEHILPERPVEGAWSQFKEEERKGYTNRLGNMVLLRQKMNSALRSAAFESKRDIYAKSDLSLTRGVAKWPQWEKGAIDDRQKYLAELAVKAWSIEP